MNYIIICTLFYEYGPQIEELNKEGLINGCTEIVMFMKYYFNEYKFNIYSIDAIKIEH